MDFRSLHDWSVAPRQAVALQKKLRSEVRIEPLERPVRFVAGADISFDQGSDVVYAGFVVLDLLRGLSIASSASAVWRAEFPYVPGLLTFREAPALLEAWKRLELEPDVVVFDGQGIAHPRRLGIASHLGLFLERPSIGCGKSRLIGHFEEPGREAGSWSPLLDKGERIGAVLRTKDGVSPVFVSPGHRIDLDSSIRLLLRTVRGYRIPEPTRQAHLFVNRLRRDGAVAELQGRLFA